MNRLEFAIDLASRLNLDTTDTTGAPADVLVFGTYGGAGAVAALMRAGIFTGGTDGLFNPTQPMTRAASAIVFQRTFNLNGGSLTYTDVPSGQWYSGAVAAVTGAGLFGGTSSGAFDPNGEFTSNHMQIVWGRTGGMTPITGTGNTGTTNPPGANPTDPTEPTEEITQDARDYVRRSLATFFNIPEGDADSQEMRQFVEDALRGGWTPERQAEEFKITGVYQRRFGTARSGEGDPPEAHEILAFEKEARAVMRRSGLPTGFWDSNEDLQQIMAAGVAVDELQERTDLVYTQVNAAPLEVRAWYAERFGLAGDDALAAVIFDPDYSEAQLDDMFRDAQAGGAGARYGFTLSDQLASRLSEIGVDYQSGSQGFAALKNLTPLFSETFGEERDMSALDEGVDAQFSMGGNGMRDLQSRVRSRLSRFQGGGEAFGSEAGITGLGTAE